MGRLWPVSSRPCDCRTSRRGFHRATWETIFPHTAVDDTPPSKVVTYSKSLLIVNSIQHTPFSTYTHTHVCPTQSRSHRHTHTHTRSHTIIIAHLLSRATLTYNSLTVRSYTILHTLLCLCFLSLPTGPSVLTYWSYLVLSGVFVFICSLVSLYSGVGGKAAALKNPGAGPAPVCCPEGLRW